MRDHPEFERQCALEKEMTSEGVTNYKSAMLKAQLKGQESSLPAGLRMLKAAIVPTAAKIREFIEQAKSGRAGRRHLSIKYLEGIDPETVAYLVAKVLLDKVSGPSLMLQRVAQAVGGAVEDEVRFRTYEEVAKDSYNLTERSLEKTSNSRHRKRVLVFQMNRSGLEWAAWPAKDVVHLGIKLIELFVEATSLVEVVQTDGTRWRVRATETTLGWLEQSNARHALLCPVLLPCLIPPKPWTSPLSGGYWTTAVRRQPLVKTRSTGYLDELFNTDMPDVYEALNAVQNTAWSINKNVLVVAEEMWAKELGLGTVLPARGGQPLPAKPGWLVPEFKSADMGEAQRAEFREWKQASAEVWTENARSISRRMQTGRVLQVAERFSPERAIYFPHNLDFRGRLYAIPSFLNPQGGDLAKGLLQFANGKALGNETAAGWLAIHGANTFGFDKASLEERIGWVDDNQAAILACAADPLGESFWQDADSPWCFLAFCFEWAGFCEHGLEFVSQIAVALDGSCNGIQHYSAMLRDPVGGAAVNLVPADRPSDIYGEVAKVATASLRLNLSTNGDDAETSRLWIEFGIDRKITKRPVMVLPYGGTYMSCKDYVEAAVKERIASGAANPWASDRRAFSKALHHLAKHVWAAISTVVVASKEAMAWLQAGTRLAAKTGLPINWRTPDGFRVQQAYKEMATTRIETKVFGQRIDLNLVNETATVDERRQVTAIAPNFVHSMDASALRASVIIAGLNGLSSFAMIHDSYGTLAADTEALGLYLRHAFVDMYQDHDVLAEFRTGIAEMLPTEAQRDKLLPVPAKGSLDIASVLLSDFFFA